MDIYQKSFNLLKEINAKIAENRDERVKQVEDRIKIWDGSGNKDKTTLVKRSGIDPLFENSAIVIETNCNETMDNVKNNYFPASYDLDLLVVFPDNTQVYVASKFVKIID